jgi:hypothetical protein
MKRKNVIAIWMHGLLGLALIFGLMSCGTGAKATPSPTETALPTENETPIAEPVAIPAESDVPDNAPAKTAAPVVRTLPQGVYRIENKTTFSIHELYYALPGTFDWQENLLEDKAPLQTGDNVEFTLSPAYTGVSLDFCIITVEYILNAPASMPFLVTGRSEDIITIIDNDLEQDRAVPLPMDWLWE